MSTGIPENENAENADVEDDAFLDDDGVLYDDDVTPEYGVLGFTVRELSIVGVWAAAFVASFFPLVAGSSIWGSGIQWILPIGVPTVAVFLLVLRRFSPDGIRRVGSLGIDQFASVAFSVAAVWWVGGLWSSIASVVEFGVWTLNGAGIVQLVASLALVALTVFAPIIPVLKEDFHGRLVTLAHRNANPVRPVVARPREERAAPPASSGHDEAATENVDETPHADASVEGASMTTATEDAASVDAAPAVGAPIDAASPVDTRATLREATLSADAVDVQATDEVARLDLPDQVPLASHASGGGTGTEDVASDETYAPAYSRRSRQPEIISDTGGIETFLDEVAVPVDDSHAWDGSEPAPVDATPAASAHDATAVQPVVAPSSQPFWILAPTERDVYDERGQAIYRIGPTAWALVIEDRGGAFVVRHDDGRIGYLHDIADISKG